MTRTPRLSRPQLVALDGLAATAYLALLAPGEVVRADLPVRVALPLMLAVGAPVAVRRLWPAPIFLLVFVASLTALAAGLLTDPLVAAAFALYPVAVEARRSWLPTTATGAIATGILVVGSVSGTPSGGWPRVGTAALGAGFIAGAWTIGRAVRERRAEAVRSAAELAGRAVAEERLRIARELHDVVAHSMSVIAVQAGTANHVMAIRPSEAQAALRVIETTSRAALTEMRQLLSVLRSRADEAELTPLPGLSGLPTLVRRAEEAGVRVELDVRGTDKLTGGVALSVFRIVQEALTNVVRHAAPTRCDITVAAEAGEVTIEVIDAGRGATPTPPDRSPDDPSERGTDAAGAPGSPFGGDTNNKRDPQASASAPDGPSLRGIDAAGVPGSAPGRGINDARDPQLSSPEPDGHDGHDGRDGIEDGTRAPGRHDGDKPGTQTPPPGLSGYDGHDAQVPASEARGNDKPSTQMPTAETHGNNKPSTQMPTAETHGNNKPGMQTPTPAASDNDRPGTPTPAESGHNRPGTPTPPASGHNRPTAQTPRQSGHNRPDAQTSASGASGHHNPGARTPASGPGRHHNPGTRTRAAAWSGNDGPIQPAPEAGVRVGHGLIGMRERVLMYGGSFRAGPRSEGGFGVFARLPYEP